MAKIVSTFGELPAVGYVRQSQLIGVPDKPGILPFSSPTLWRLVKAGKFPAPVKLSNRVTAWDVALIRAWMQARNTGGVST